MRSFRQINNAVLSVARAVMHAQSYTRELDKKEKAILILFNRLFSPNDRFSIFSDIPDARIKGAEGKYLRLSDSEPLVAIYDSILLGNHAKSGVAVTTRGLYWRHWPQIRKNFGSLLYKDLTGTVFWEDNVLRLNSGVPKLVFILASRNLAFQRAFLAFLQEAASIYGATIAVKAESVNLPTDRKGADFNNKRSRMEELKRAIKEALRKEWKKAIWPYKVLFKVLFWVWVIIVALYMTFLLHLY